VKKVCLGTDQDIFNFRKSEKLERPALLLLGRLDPVKGHYRFLRSFARIINSWNEACPSPCLLLVGEPQNLSELTITKKISSLNLKLGDDVKFFPKRVNNIVEMIRQSHLGVIPSLWSEEICRVAQEFLISGVPLWVSGVGALDECLYENSGLSYKGLSLEESERLLKELIVKSYNEDSAERQQRANIAHKKFSFSTMKDNLLEVVRLAKSNSRRS